MPVLVENLSTMVWMNTKDFDLYYKDEAGEWKLAKAVRGNKAHVSDITLIAQLLSARLAFARYYI